MANNTPVSVNYTNRDYYSLRDDLITRIQAKIAETNNGKQWSGTEPSDFGVAMVEAFAYVGDLTSYYIDRVANEGFLPTATQRKSILDLAALFGYTPSGYRQSSVVLSFSNSSLTDTVLIPSGTEFSVDIATSQGVYQQLFTLSEDVLVVPAADVNTPGTAVGLAYHGYNVSMLAENAAGDVLPNDISGELLGYSDGYGSQQFELAYNQVVDGTLSVFVHDGSSFVQWSAVRHLADYGPLDSVYSLTTDENNYVTVVFGDGISGAIPTMGSAIKATYFVGGGLEGNIEGGKSFNIYRVPVESNLTLNDLSTITVYNGISDAATGGEDPESNASIRANAPLALRTMQRAVTLKDYQDLALSVANVGKAYAVATQPTSVALYIAPTTSDTSNDYFPGFNAANTAVTDGWKELKSTVADYFADKTQVGVSVSVLPPVYVPVSTNIRYIKSPSYTHEQVVSALRYSVVYNLGFNYLDFNTVIYPEQVEGLLLRVPGTNAVSATKLYRVGSSESRTTLIPAVGEYFVFQDGDVNVYPAASVSTLTASSGTFSPVFKSHVFDYSLVGVSTSTITLTPTLWDAGDVVTINGSVVSSGSASASISTPTGTTLITVVVTSEDNLSSNTYTITVTR